MTNSISDQLRPILQSALSGNRNWLPNHVYAGVAQDILANGSIAVLINNKVYYATTHIPVHSGDLLNLRLTGTTPEPSFVITGLAALPAPAQRAVAIQQPALPAVAMFGKLNPGIEGLATLLLQYPAELRRISPLLQPLLLAISANILPASDIANPARLQSHVFASGFFYDAHAAAGIAALDSDLKALLFRLFGVLQHKRMLTLLNGRPGFIDYRPPSSQGKAATSVAQYIAQDDNSLARDLKHIISQNAESTLLQIVASQLAARDKSTGTDSIFLMNLMIGHEETFVPLELELRQRGYAGEEFWEAAFTIELPHSGKMHWTMAVKNPSVSVELGCHKESTRACMTSRAGFLGELMELQDLILVDFSCTEVESI